MAKKIHHFEGFSIVKAGVEIALDMSRIEKNFNQAQFALDSAVMTSMVPFMPHSSGSFINRTRYESASVAGTGSVIAAVAPQGRYLYSGKLMIDPVTRSAWARKGAKKVLTEKNLRFSRGRAKWFDAAKKADSKSWIRVVKNIAGGG